MSDDRSDGASGSGSGSGSADTGPSTSASSSSAAPSSSTSTSSSSSSSSSSSASASDELHAQAVRFLTSVRLHGHSSEDEQRAFLRSKGLDDAAIERAYKDAARPVGAAASSSTSAASDAGPKALSSSSAVSDSVVPQEAFEAAARAFDDPINAAPLPAKTYPRSPLALYYDEDAGAGAGAGPQAGAAAPGALPQSAAQQDPLTRYQVLLSFFRQLSYVMMMGGGATAVLVGLYRAFIMPRLIASQDARSIVLRHHRELYEQLTTKVRALRRASLAQSPHVLAHNGGGIGGGGSGGVGALGADAEHGAAPGGRQLKSALKRVSFAHDTKDPAPDAPGSGSGSGSSGEEDAGSSSSSSSSSEKAPLIGKEKVVVPGSDVVVGALTDEGATAKDGAVEGGEAAAGANQDGNGKPAKKKAKPIDVNASLRESLARLTQALKADMSSASAGAPVIPAPNASAAGQAAGAGARAAPRAATVRDGAEEELLFDDDDDSAGEDDDDDDDDDADAADGAAGDDDEELEFDPYGSYAPKKRGRRAGRKHGQRTSALPSATSASASNATPAPSAGPALRAALASLTGAVGTQTYMASTMAYGGSGAPFRFGGLGADGLFGGSSSGTSAANADEKDKDAQKDKAGDINVVKAEIRGLKGLLLSRRNFPSYSRPGAPSVSTQG